MIKKFYKSLKSYFKKKLGIDKLEAYCENLEQTQKKQIKRQDDHKFVLDRTIKELHAEREKLKNLEKENEAFKVLIKYLSTSDLWLEKNRNKYKGQTCFLLGCGPSLSGVDLDLLKDHYIAGVNGVALIEGLELDFFFSVSYEFWKDHTEKLKNVNSKMRFLPQHLKQLESNIPTTWLNSVDEKQSRYLGEGKPWCFSRNASKMVFMGGSVVFVALQVLYYLGFEEVILLGIDHDYGLSQDEKEKIEGIRRTGESLNAHFLDNYYSNNASVHIDILGAERAYSLAREAFDLSGKRIYNATEGTKLDIFDKVSLEEKLQELKVKG